MEGTVTVFGNWKDHVAKDSQDLKEFYFRGRTIILHGVGSESAVRGTNRDNVRPDVIISDDAQTAENAKSSQLSSNFRTWYHGTLLYAKNNFACTIIYIGNMYPNQKDELGRFQCMLRALKDDPTWVSYITGAILEDGESLWEEVQPIKNLLAELQSNMNAGLPQIFLAEKMNDPDAHANSKFNPAKVPHYTPGS